MGAQISSNPAQPIVRTAIHQPRTKVNKCQKCAEHKSSTFRLPNRLRPSRQKLQDLEQGPDTSSPLQQTRYKIYTKLSHLPPELRLKIYEEVVSPSSPPKICLQNLKLHHTLIDDAPVWIANEAYHILLHKVPLRLDQFPPWKYNISKQLLRAKQETFLTDRKPNTAIKIQLSIWLRDCQIWKHFAREKGGIRLKFLELWNPPPPKTPDTVMLLLYTCMSMFLIFAIPTVMAWVYLGWVVGISVLLIPVMGVATVFVLNLNFSRRRIRTRWHRHVIAWSLPVAAAVNMAFQAGFAS